MTILPILVAPDPRLKKKSLPVEKVDDALRNFMDDMVETMYAASGIGLAAVQVGVHQRILVMDIERPSERYPHHHVHGEHCNHDHHDHDYPAEPMFLINPEIIATSDNQTIYEEGCLSFPGQYAPVTRPEKVTIRYLDYHGNPQIMEAEGLLATCVQHEMDHLNGITFVDHLSRIKREMILKKLQKAKDENL